MAPPIVYDSLRLLLGGLTQSPRGIDRVNFAYARFLFENWPGECLCLLPTPWGMRLYSRESGLRMLDFARSAWRENVAADTDPAFAALRQWLTRQTTVTQLFGKRRQSGWAANGARFLLDHGVQLGRPAVRQAPKNAIYLNVGQLGWAAPVMTHWLKHRPDLRAVFMLHDTIPLHYPTMVSNAGRVVYGWMMSTVIRRAAGLLTTTGAATDSVTNTLHDAGLPRIPTCAPDLRPAPSRG